MCLRSFYFSESMGLLGVVIAMMAMTEGLILCEDEDKSCLPSLQKNQ